MTGEAKRVAAQTGAAAADRVDPGDAAGYEGDGFGGGVADRAGGGGADERGRATSGAESGESAVAPARPAPRAAGRMNLLCRLGRHAPGAIPRWNDGYYFATCHRCGQDIVRTAYERWHVPAGYRVVWSATSPEGRPDARLAPAPAVQPSEEEIAAPPAEAEAAEPVVAEVSRAEPSKSEPEPARPKIRKRRGLPIEAVLAHLHDDEPAAVAEEAAAPEAVPIAAPPPRDATSWDFMEEEPAEEEWVSALPAFAPVPGSAEAGPREARSAADVYDRPAKPPKPPRPPRLRPALARLRAASAKLVDHLRQRDGSLPWMIAAAAFMIAASIAVLAIILSPPRAYEPETPHYGAAEATRDAVPQPSTGAGGTEAFVTASVLSCRTAPAMQARRVRNLGRGDAVRVLAREGEWVSIAHRGAQCWALARFVSGETPL